MAMDWNECKELFETAVLDLRKKNEERKGRNEAPIMRVNVFDYVFRKNQKLQETYGRFAKNKREKFDTAYNLRTVLDGKSRELELDPGGLISLGATDSSSSGRRSSRASAASVNLDVSQIDEELDIREVSWQSFPPISIAVLIITLPSQNQTPRSHHLPNVTKLFKLLVPWRAHCF